MTRAAVNSKLNLQHDKRCKKKHTSGVGGTIEHWTLHDELCRVRLGAAEEAAHLPTWPGTRPTAGQPWPGAFEKNHSILLYVWVTRVYGFMGCEGVLPSYVLECIEASTMRFLVLDVCNGN